MNFVIPDDYDQAYLGSPHVERLIPHGKVQVYTDPPRDEGELIERLRPAEVVIPIRERTPFTAERLLKLPSLRLISMTGTGVASIDLKTATVRRVVVTNTPGTSVPAVVELTFGLMIALCRRLPAIDREIREGGWPRHVGSELSGKSLGIIGLGAIGSRVAEVAQAFGMEVCAWSPRLTADRARRLRPGALTGEPPLGRPAQRGPDLPPRLGHAGDAGPLHGGRRRQRASVSGRAARQRRQPGRPRVSA